MRARNTASSRAARRAARFAHPSLKYNPPWRLLVLRYLPKSMNLTEVYRRMGWTDQIAGQRRKFFHLELRIAAQLAKAVKAPLAKFLLELAELEGIPPLHERVIHKPLAWSKARGRTLSSQRCGVCQELGHTKVNCPNKKPSAQFQLDQARASASPIKYRRAKKRRLNPSE